MVFISMLPSRKGNRKRLQPSPAPPQPQAPRAQAGVADQASHVRELSPTPVKFHVCPSRQRFPRSQRTPPPTRHPHGARPWTKDAGSQPLPPMHRQHLSFHSFTLQMGKLRLPEVFVVQRHGSYSHSLELKAYHPAICPLFPPARGLAPTLQLDSLLCPCAVPSRLCPRSSKSCAQTQEGRPCPPTPRPLLCACTLHPSSPGSVPSQLLQGAFASAPLLCPTASGDISGKASLPARATWEKGLVFPKLGGSQGWKPWS